MAFENDDHFFIEMFLRVQSAAGRNLADVHAGDPFHAVEIQERRLAACARPSRGADITHIFDAVAVDHRDAFLGHPAKVCGLVKSRHQSFNA